MDTREMVEKITQEVLARLKATGSGAGAAAEAKSSGAASAAGAGAGQVHRPHPAEA